MTMSLLISGFSLRSFQRFCRKLTGVPQSDRHRNSRNRQKRWHWMRSSMRNPRRERITKPVFFKIHYLPPAEPLDIAELAERLWLDTAFWPSTNFVRRPMRRTCCRTRPTSPNFTATPMPRPWKRRGSNGWTVRRSVKRRVLSCAARSLPA